MQFSTWARFSSTKPRLLHPASKCASQPNLEPLPRSGSYLAPAANSHMHAVEISTWLQDRPRRAVSRSPNAVCRQRLDQPQTPQRPQVRDQVCCRSTSGSAAVAVPEPTENTVVWMLWTAPTIWRTKFAYGDCYVGEPQTHFSARHGPRPKACFENVRCVGALPLRTLDSCA